MLRRFCKTLSQEYESQCLELRRVEDTLGVEVKIKQTLELEKVALQKQEKRLVKQIQKLEADVEVEQNLKH
jgi:hypothetical protein